MRKTTLFCLAVVFLITVPLIKMNGQTHSSRESDEAAIRKSWQDYVAAWNKHDTKLLTAFFAEDVDRRTANGDVSNSRSATLAGIEKSFGPKKEAALASIQVDVRFLAPDVAMLDARDEERIDGVSVRTNHTSIFVRQNGKWLTAAIRAWRLTPSTAQAERK